MCHFHSSIKASAQMDHVKLYAVCSMQPHALWSCVLSLFPILYGLLLLYSSIILWQLPTCGYLLFCCKILFLEIRMGTFRKTVILATFILVQIREFSFIFLIRLQESQQWFNWYSCPMRLNIRTSVLRLDLIRHWLKRISPESGFIS